MRLLLIAVGVLALGFGVACLNYTADGKATHHREWASEHGMPEPSERIFLVGVAGTALGAGLAGFALGRRGRRA